MNSATARAIENWIGWMILAASITQIPLLIAGATLFGMGASGYLLWVSWALFAFATGAGIALIQRTKFGFYLLYFAMFLCFFGPHFNFLPLIRRVVPPGPEMDYYFMGANVIFALLAAFCHWRIAREDGDKRAQFIPILFALLTIMGSVYWKSGLRTFDQDAPNIAEIPLFGPKLTPLKSSTPVALRGLIEHRSARGMIVFRGSTTEENVRAFAVINDLKRMTNNAARVKFLPLVKTWKLDPKRFPVFNGDADFCYVGRLPKGSKTAFQLCYRPTDGRYTALIMGSVTP